MQPTIYPHVNELIDTLLMQMQAVLGQKLVGLYLTGSLVSGDDDDEIGDVALFSL